VGAAPGVAVAKAPDQKVAVARRGGVDLIDSVALKPPPQARWALGKEPARGGRASEDQVPARAQHAGYLANRGARVELGDQVEQIVGVGERRRPTDLEGDATLGIEPDSGGSGPDSCLRGVDAAQPGSGELSGEEEHRFALSTTYDQGSLGGARDPQCGGSQRRERGRGQASMIASGRGWVAII